MEMTAAEIRTSYKSAKYPGKQLRVLAELNDTTPGKIKAILGEELKQPVKRGPGRPAAEPRKAPEAVLALVEARIDELERIIHEYEKEYSQLSEFMKGEYKNE